jgi:hypothetical protein
MKLTYEQCYAIGQANGVSSAIVESIARAISALATEGGGVHEKQDDFVPCKCESDEGRICGRCHAWDDMTNPSAKQEAVGIVKYGSLHPLHTPKWRFEPLVDWENIGEGTKLYAAPQSQGEKASQESDEFGPVTDSELEAARESIPLGHAVDCAHILSPWPFESCTCGFLEPKSQGEKAVASEDAREAARYRMARRDGEYISAKDEARIDAAIAGEKNART